MKSKILAFSDDMKPEEPLAVLRGSDPIALKVLMYYRKLFCEECSSDEKTLDAITATILRFDHYARNKDSQ